MKLPKSVALLAIASAAALPLPALACAGLTWSELWIREAPPGASVMAGYGKLVNAGRKPLTITALDGADFAAVQLHQSSTVDGSMRMRRVDPLTLAPGQSLELAPGGYHLMMMQPKPTLAGSSRITLHCADGDLAAELPVRKP